MCVRVCVCACVRVCVRACVRACVHVCLYRSKRTSPSVVRSGPNLAHTHGDSHRKGSGQNKNLLRVT